MRKHLTTAAILAALATGTATPAHAAEGLQSDLRPDRAVVTVGETVGLRWMLTNTTGVDVPIGSWILAGKRCGQSFVPANASTICETTVTPDRAGQHFEGSYILAGGDANHLHIVEGLDVVDAPTIEQPETRWYGPWLGVKAVNTADAPVYVRVQSPTHRTGWLEVAPGDTLYEHAGRPAPGTVTLSVGRFDPNLGDVVATQSWTPDIGSPSEPGDACSRAARTLFALIGEDLADCMDAGIPGGQTPPPTPPAGSTPPAPTPTKHPKPTPKPTQSERPRQRVTLIPADTADGGPRSLVPAGAAGLVVASLLAAGGFGRSARRLSGERTAP